ncbi:CaiB/BaiF CoA-transferase family protein [Acinetobacter sichuanensis]|uniref:CaiB/BaiF CoA transferase family protein n=1 Tax=Acinetobacter sichuanensis TaxID=2136183 RepID=UPI00280D08E7|nr:CaiB/BaiF CoA-transferase family protein [Acinetobacter sichuanensis]MDQ9021297.1 CaiB/BaiF CoA-transferase family protein [Acinetobacter sichuanensis]
MRALEGIRVLDLSRVLAGPWCSQILADLGAEVIKIEHPDRGDDTRFWGPPWMKDDQGENTQESAYYQTANRNKLSVCVDIAQPEGQDIIQKMVLNSDILIENFKTHSLKKYGLDYESLKKINPQLIYCSITGFGQTGPRAEQPGYDFIIQGLGGLMSITGEKDDLAGGGPQKVGVAVTDLTTGLYATIAIQAALLARNKTGIGQHLDISLLDVQISMLANQGMNYLSSDIAPVRTGNSHPNIVPYQVFKAKNSHFILACGNDSQFKALCHAIDRADLNQNMDFQTNALRVKHRIALTETLQNHFMGQNAAYWVEKINAVKVPVGLINNIAQALDEPQVKHRNMVVEQAHPLNQNFKMIGSPLKLSDTPVEYQSPPPTLGQHTFSVLADYFDEDKIQELVKHNIIK